jgi:H+/gluconate symporter-like permease
LTANSFVGFGCNPFRTIARANISGVTSGQSEKLISAAVIASSRSQSVPEGLEVSFLPILLTSATTQITHPPSTPPIAAIHFNFDKSPSALAAMTLPIPDAANSAPATENTAVAVPPEPAQTDN